MKKYLSAIGFTLFILSISPHVQAQIITTIAGNGTPAYSGDGGQATAAELNDPWCVTLDKSGNIYIGDAEDNHIRKISTSGIITTIGGGGSVLGDGGPATAALFTPVDIAFDTGGNMYVADQNNRIRIIDKSGVINTIAGGGTVGLGDGGPATVGKIDTPLSVALDYKGNVYIADYGNNRVRKVDTSHVISTFAGNGMYGFSGDGFAATTAEFERPTGVSVDRYGNVYICDYYNARIRKVDTFGIITTFAGNGTPGFSGDGTPATVAELNEPQTARFDSTGNLYVADLANQRIRKINTAGIISTVAGNGTSGFLGDGTPATTAEISYPTGVAADSKGNIFIADQFNNRVRKVFQISSLSINNLSNAAGTIGIYPNPANEIITIKANNINGIVVFIQVTDITGRILLEKEVNNNNQNLATSFDIKALSAGMYFVTVKTETQQYVNKIVKE